MRKKTSPVRVADYVIDFLYRKGATHLFTIAGGGAMFLNDAAVCHSKIQTVCHHHEQAAAMAADAFAKMNNTIGAALFTSGPGSTNAITGLLGVWQDSNPCMFISSQSKLSQMSQFSGVPSLRQFGIQEVNIIPLVQPLTKYAAVVKRPEDIRYQLERAYHLATHGRPGPVWLDIPQDVASKQIDPNTLTGFTPTFIQPVASKQDIAFVHAALQKAKRPLIIAGGGVRLGRAVEQLRKVIELLHIPVVVPLMGLDLLEHSHPLYVGHGGTKGQRAANIAIQRADLLLVLGSRLAVSFTGHEYRLFAAQANKIVVDIDREEHTKKTISIDRFIHSDVLVFLNKLHAYAQKKQKQNRYTDWIARCQTWKKMYPACIPEYTHGKGRVNMYFAVSEIARASKPNDVFITDAGTTAYVMTQGLILKKNQRTIFPGCTLTMGYNLPAAVGVWAADKRKRIICVTGDGSFQMNIHELQTIVHHRIPVIIFVTNNEGYLAIRTTQRNFFQSRFIGEAHASGVSFPSTQKIAAAYTIPYVKISTSSQVRDIVPVVMQQKGPVICEILCPRWQDILTVTSQKKEDGTMVSMPIDYMSPLLQIDELTDLK